MSPLTYSSIPGLVLAQNRAKNSGDNRAANALQTVYGQVPAGADSTALLADSSQPLGFRFGSVGASLASAMAYNNVNVPTANFNTNLPVPFNVAKFDTGGVFLGSGKLGSGSGIWEIGFALQVNSEKAGVTNGIAVYVQLTRWNSLDAIQEQQNIFGYYIGEYGPTGFTSVSQIAGSGIFDAAQGDYMGLAIYYASDTFTIHPYIPQNGSASSLQNFIYAKRIGNAV